MKTLKLAIALLLFFITTVKAQPGDMPGEKGKEKIKAMKIGFLTERLNLSSDEATKFWPVYNGFQKETEDLRKNRKIERREAREEFDAMSDKDAEKLIDDEIAFRQRELDVVKKYHAQFKQVLPPKKVALLYKAEEDFKRELLERIRNRMDEKREMKRGGGGPLQR